MTFQQGGTVKWTFTATNGYWRADDSVELQLGDGADLRLFHNGTNSIIRNDAGNLSIFSSTTEVARIVLGGNARFHVLDGSQSLPAFGWFNDTDNGFYRIGTNNFGTSVGGTLRQDWTTSATRLVTDNYELQIGASSDLRLYHDGTNSIIRNDTGYLQMQGSLVRVVPDSSAIPSAAINADSVFAVGRDSTSVSIGLVAPNGGSNGFRFVCAAGGIAALAAINVASNSYLGYVGASGYDGTAWQTGAAGLFGIRPGSTWSGTNRETFLTFETTANGSTARVERARINDARADFAVPVQLPGYTVATLPAGAQGDIAYVTDALAPTFLTAVVGGGAVVTPVFYDGTNWVSY